MNWACVEGSGRDPGGEPPSPGLHAGTCFVVVAERDVVVFEVVQAPEAEEFAGLVAQARAVARDEGLRVADARRAVREARRKA